MFGRQVPGFNMEEEEDEEEEEEITEKELKSLKK